MQAERLRAAFCEGYDFGQADKAFDVTDAAEAWLGSETHAQSEPGGAEPPQDTKRYTQAELEESLRVVVDQTIQNMREGRISGAICSQCFQALASGAGAAPPPVQDAQECANPRPFIDTPLLAAKRCAFDNPTQANLDALIAAAIASREP